MKLLRLILSLSLTILLIYFLNNSIGSIPPIGKLLDPFHGFWQNTETASFEYGNNITLKGLNDIVTVQYEERRVPHLFAQNESDLYYVLGYLNARDRLFQMDFEATIAGGELSSILGESTLPIDRYLRRIGMRKAANTGVNEINRYTKLKVAIGAYTKGVNAYIAGLNYKDYPIEYKLLNIRPKPWSPLRTANIMMLLKLELGSFQEDFEKTNAFKIFGKELYNELYPDFPPGIDPIVPDTTSWDFDPLPFDTLDYDPTQFIPIKLPYQPNPANGSNNWAISGSKTESGKPILANDPHLGLNLPSIWYEVQLSCPEFNAYGVMSPGAPVILIGFNEYIAWGETNSNRDYMDWYGLKFNDEGDKYLFEGEYKTLSTEVETIEIKGKEDFIDTIHSTHFGRIVFDTRFLGDSTKNGLVMHWKASDTSNELLTFYKLNRAKNYNEYLKSIVHYEFPAQNFAFASKSGDIALWQHGYFDLRNWNHGKYLLDGSLQKHQLQGKIPKSHNPKYKNPSRGFVSSANQHPAGVDYPYYYTGNFEFYRNRRINPVLESGNAITPEQIMKLQNDNYSIRAAEDVPHILEILAKNDWSVIQTGYLDLLKNWDYYYGIDAKAATIFELFWSKFLKLAVDEGKYYNLDIPEPRNYVISGLMKSNPGHSLFDQLNTPQTETADDLFLIAFNQTVDSLEIWKSKTGMDIQWKNFKGAQLTHLLKTLEPFHIKDIPIGGAKEIVNASAKTHGPSWRMIVSLEDEIRAWGIYPGGQSGNPGSPFYGNFVEKWAEGSYYELLFLKNSLQKPEQIVFTQQFNN